MSNLRLVSVQVVDSATIIANFTNNLSPYINATNIEITSELDSAPDSKVISVDVQGKSLTITSQPLTPVCPYFISFKSSPTSSFESVNGDFLLDDSDPSNKKLIVGPPEPENPSQKYLFNYLQDNLYNVTDTTTTVNKVIQGMSLLLSKTLYDINQVKNENYISLTVRDEQKTRGLGPFDRLDEEGAYEIIRVSKGRTGENYTTTSSANFFLDNKITLQSKDFSEKLILSNQNKEGFFNYKDFVLNLTKKNVIKIDKIKFVYGDGRPNFEYSVADYGYQLLDPSYDIQYCFPYLTLSSNQVKINQDVFSSGLVSLINLSKITVSVDYKYKDQGRFVNANSVKLTSVFSSIREEIPPLSSVFSLSNAPILDTSGNVAQLGALTFFNMDSLKVTDSHPAFLSEKTFRLDSLPSSPGEYAVDYSTGTVYVFGESASNQGTGARPPLVSYQYLHTYKDSLDYVYDEDSYELSALPDGNLVNSSAKISFQFEDVFTNGIDYKAAVHQEVINERIGNKILSDASIRVSNGPVTNVFRVMNETSGEVYSPYRWNNDRIYYSYSTPPQFNAISGERVSFSQVSGEILSRQSSITNSSGITVAVCNLANSKIISKSEDSIGYVKNSSVEFSNKSTFKKEKWFDRSAPSNFESLLSIGDYTIDYDNGVVYVAVTPDYDNGVVYASSLSVPTSPSPSFNGTDFGTVSYKKPSIKTQKQHITNVNDIYYNIDGISKITKKFNYVSFSDSEILLKDIDTSDNDFININNAVCDLSGGNQISSDETKSIRGIFEANDLSLNNFPINFAESSDISSGSIKLGPITKSKHDYVKYSSADGYYVNLDIISTSLSPNITFSVLVKRKSDGATLSCTLSADANGEPVKAILSGASISVNDFVFVTTSISINSGSRIVVDRNRGELYADYVHLADEIVVSYEYGENLLDFRESSSLSTGDNYFVSYKIGALRDALISNFGSVANITELSEPDLTLNRERYRDAISAVFGSIKDGPTESNIKNVVKKIAHVEPRIIESMFNGWSLGSSLLSPRNIISKGTFSFAKGKYDRGILFEKENNTICVPTSSNFRLESGTFQCWVIPNWNGIDNQADITFSIFSGNRQYNTKDIFVGALEFHPKYDKLGGSAFTISKAKVLPGKPNLNKNGVFIYYDKDAMGLFDRWYVQVVDSNPDATFDLNIDITTNGSFYDAKPTVSSVSKINSSNKTISLRIRGKSSIKEEICFIADKDHYILDSAESEGKNRFSLFKDPSGFINFRVIDKYGAQYSVSSDVSSWKTGELHQVAISWSLASKNKQDEMHLFIDGKEVPNIVRYGVKNTRVGHSKFRVISKEEIAGIIDKKIISSNDLNVAGNTNFAYANSTVFYGVNSGDTLFINEPGFDPSGYTITLATGSSIILNSKMPFSLAGARYTVNKKTIALPDEFNDYSKFFISKLSSITYGNDLSVSSGTTLATSASYNFSDNNISPGDIIRIYNASNDIYRTVLSVSGTSVTFDDDIGFTDTACYFDIYKNKEIELRGPAAISPDYSVSVNSSGSCELTLLNNLDAKDILTIKTLGLKERKISQKYFSWSKNNIIRTTLPQPTSMNSVKISRILFPNTAINADNSEVKPTSFTYKAPSSSFSFGSLSSPDPRSLLINISTDNIDFSAGTLDVQIVGLPASETVSFSDTRPLRTTNKFTSISDIIVKGSFKNSGKTYLTLEVKEALPITEPEDVSSTNYPVIRYSYQVKSGTDLSCTDGKSLYSNSQWLPSFVGCYIKIPSVPYALKILSCNTDSSGNSYLLVNNLTPLPALSNESYEIVQASDKSSGFQNGSFIFEKSNNPGEPYQLPPGEYEIKMRVPLSVNIGPMQSNAFFGTDFRGSNVLQGVLDEIKVNIDVLKDTRIGEQIDSNQETITKNFHSIKRLLPNKNTLLLCHLNDFPLTNEAPFYLLLKDKKMLEPGVSVNDEFDRSVLIKEKPIVVENNGILNPGKEGTIEFWVSPIFDSINDYSERFYFDATSVVKEDTVSINDSTLQLSGNVGKVLGVNLKNGDNSTDYFSAGSVEISPSGAVVEVLDISNDIFTPESSVKFIVSEDRTGFLYLSGTKASLDIYVDSSNIKHNNVGLLKIDKSYVDQLSFDFKNADFVGKRVRIINPKNENNNNSYYVIGYDSSTDTLTIVNDMDSYCILPQSSPKALQIISVKLFNDPSGKDYFDGGAIGKDGRTIYFGTNLPELTVPFSQNQSNKKIIVTYKPLEGPWSLPNSKIIRLNKRLPSQNTQVTVTYIPAGLSGDRMSIYKDSSSYLNFSIVASGIENKIRCPIFWQRNTWHRVKATYRVNTGKNADEMSLFVDGREYGNTYFGSGAIFGNPGVSGSSQPSVSTPNKTIKIKDFFNTLYFGSDFTEKNNAYCLIDNLRISNISRPKFFAFGQSIDVNYNANTSVSLPVKKDLYTTLLWDFDSILVKNEDFATLVNKKSGGSDFSINIFDSFGIISGSPKVKEITEKLIKILKPANSRAFLKYFD